MAKDIFTDFFGKWRYLPIVQNVDGGLKMGAGVTGLFSTSIDRFVHRVALDQINNLPEDLRNHKASIFYDRQTKRNFSLVLEGFIEFIPIFGTLFSICVDLKNHTTKKDLNRTNSPPDEFYFNALDSYFHGTLDSSHYKPIIVKDISTWELQCNGRQIFEGTGELGQVKNPMLTPLFKLSSDKVNRFVYNTPGSLLAFEQFEEDGRHSFFLRHRTGKESCFEDVKEIKKEGDSYTLIYKDGTTKIVKRPS